MPRAKQDKERSPRASLHAEIIAAVAVEPRHAAMMDLLLGVHPTEGRHLTEIEEDAADLVGLLRQNAEPVAKDEFSQALRLWRDHLPDVPSFASFPGSRRIEARWRQLLPHVQPIAGAYIFSPTLRLEQPQGQRRQETFNRAFCQATAAAKRRTVARAWPTWIFSLRPHREFRTLFEEVCGLSPSTKEQLGLTAKEGQFLRRYVSAHDEHLESLLSPREFELLVAETLESEGWACKVTRYSKDGGVDIEARRLVDGVASIKLVQVKRTRSKANASGQGKRARPVGLSEIKSFAATVRGEDKTQGILVTSSHVTADARRWAAGKGKRVALVECIDGEELRERLHAICMNNRLGEIAAFPFESAQRVP